MANELAAALDRVQKEMKEARMTNDWARGWDAVAEMLRAVKRFEAEGRGAQTPALPAPHEPHRGAA